MYVAPNGQLLRYSRNPDDNDGATEVLALDGQVLWRLPRFEDELGTFFSMGAEAITFCSGGTILRTIPWDRFRPSQNHKIPDGTFIAEIKDDVRTLSLCIDGALLSRYSHGVLFIWAKRFDYAISQNIGLQSYSNDYWKESVEVLYAWDFAKNEPPTELYSYIREHDITGFVVASDKRTWTFTAMDRHLYEFEIPERDIDGDSISQQDREKGSLVRSSFSRSKQGISDCETHLCSLTMVNSM